MPFGTLVITQFSPRCSDDTSATRNVSCLLRHAPHGLRLTERIWSSITHPASILIFLSLLCLRGEGAEQQVHQLKAYMTGLFCRSHRLVAHTPYMLPLLLVIASGYFATQHTAVRCHRTHGICGSPEVTLLLVEKQSIGNVQERGGSCGFQQATSTRYPPPRAGQILWFSDLFHIECHGSQQGRDLQRAWDFPWPT